MTKALSILEIYLVLCLALYGFFVLAALICAFHRRLLRRHPRYIVRVHAWDSYLQVSESNKYFLTKAGGWKWIRRHAVYFRDAHKSWAENIIEVDEDGRSCVLYLTGWDPPSEDPYEAEVSMTLVPLAA
jgi:hypothetical protein